MLWIVRSFAVGAWSPIFMYAMWHHDEKLIVQSCVGIFLVWFFSFLVEMISKS